MDIYLIKFVILMFCVNLAWSGPAKLSKGEENRNGDIKIQNNLHNVTVEAILKKIVSPQDTDAQKDAKKLIAQYLVGLVSQLNSTSGPSKSSKSERNHENSVGEDKIKEAIIAALIAAKNEDVNSLRTGKQLAESEPANSTEIVKTTLRPTNAKELTTEFPVETKPTNSIDKHQANILTQVNDLVTNVQIGNVSGVVDNGLKVASIETLGVVLNNFLNVLLCNPLDRVRGTCESTVQLQTKT